MTNSNPDPTVGGADRQNLYRQAHHHPLIDDESFPSLESYVTHLIHLKAYEETARLVAGKAVLDVGCNIGYGVQILSSTASFVGGIDVSPQAVKAAQQRLNSKGDIRCYDGVQCSFASHSFDVVTSFQVLEHVSDYKPYFNEILRLLKPEGMVVFTTPNALLRLEPGMKPWNEFHVREFNPSELKELLSMWFERIEIRGLFGKDEPHQIERDRCARARTYARSQGKGTYSLVQGLGRRMFLWLPQIRSRFRIRTERKQGQAKLARSEMERFSTQDFFYKSDTLEEALDLMAICRGARES